MMLSRSWGERFHALRVRTAAQRWENAKAALLQKRFKSYRTSQLWQRYAKFAAKLFRNKWRLRFALRCFRRWLSGNIVIHFLRTYMVDAAKLKILAIKFMKRIRIVQVRYGALCSTLQ